MLGRLDAFGAGTPGVAACRQTAARYWGANLAALCRGAATLLLTASAGAGQFALNYSPTGIAYDAVSNVVSLSSGSSVFTYETNGTQVAQFSAGNPFDLGAGTGGNVWVASGNNYRKYDFAGDLVTGTTIPSTTVGVGRELAIGGTNWLLYAVSGGPVVALNLATLAAVHLLSTPAGTTGADWALRPGGYALDHVVVAMNTGSSVRMYSKDGTNSFQLGQTITLNPALYGDATDVSFGIGEFWVAHDLEGAGNAVSYPFSVPAVPEASVSVGWTNGAVGVTWSGRWLEHSADLQSWTVWSNAPQPLLLAPTPAAQYFRAGK